MESLWEEIIYSVCLDWWLARGLQEDIHFMAVELDSKQFVELDSTEFVEIINMNYTSLWRIQTVTLDCFDNFYVTHVFGKGNKVVCEAINFGMMDR